MVLFALASIKESKNAAYVNQAGGCKSLMAEQISAEEFEFLWSLN